MSRMLPLYISDVGGNLFAHSDTITKFVIAEIQRIITWE